MDHEKKTLAESGELEFIRRIRLLMPGEGGNIVRSAGDDCLVVNSFGRDRMLLTTDTFVDEIHFTRSFFTWREIGGRCMAASVSDIAAMSGIPAYALLSLSMPPSMMVDDAVELFDGLAEKARSYGCSIAGGETTSTPGPLTVTVTVIGRVEPGRVVMRSGAKPGDSVYVTGCLGDAMAGLMAFRESEREFGELKGSFVRPEARVFLSRALTERFRISAMIDLSDGLASDLGHICEESCCGAVVIAGALPFSSGFRTLMDRYEKDPVWFAIASGEDYGLLFTSDDPGLCALQEILGQPVTRIGAMTAPPGHMELLLGDGALEPILTKGYEHFTA